MSTYEKIFHWLIIVFGLSYSVANDAEVQAASVLAVLVSFVGAIIALRFRK